MTEIYVVPFFGNWAIKMTGKESPLSTHNRKDEAVKIATRLSRRHDIKIVIIDENDNSGNDSK